jgi:hypothetical protein
MLCCENVDAVVPASAVMQKAALIRTSELKCCGKNIDTLCSARFTAESGCFKV